MSESQDKRPFYLRSNAPNVITPSMIKKFQKSNPDLSQHLMHHSIALRPLRISHFESFCAWIISQQISGYVAEILYKRFKDKYTPVLPQTLIDVDDDELLDIGLSRSKIQYIRNIADYFLQGYFLQNFDDYSSDQLRKHYTSIKGIGPWTVNMWLIFKLGRLDIFASRDLAVRKGLKILYDLEDVPSIAQSVEIGGDWGDLATIGTLLAWAVIGE